MKATGIVRRIDELGRIVIPKEIRRTQRIRQGDALEIFTAADGEVVFKKYSPLSGGYFGAELANPAAWIAACVFLYPAYIWTCRQLDNRLLAARLHMQNPSPDHESAL